MKNETTTSAQVKWAVVKTPNGNWIRVASQADIDAYRALWANFQAHMFSSKK